jgi:protein SCO1
MMKHQNLWIALTVVLATALVWLAFFWEPAELLPFGQQPPHSRLQLEKTPAGGDFRLQSPTGPVSLSDYHGKVVLIYFGYTYCPDICPTSLSTLGQAFSALTSDEQEKVAGLFISVDPERDTMEILKAYAPFFHPNIVGISGTPDQVAQIARQYGAFYMKQKPDSNGLYSVDHSSFTYVVAPDGKLAASLPHGSPPRQIVDMIRTLLKKKIQTDPKHPTSASN